MLPARAPRASRPILVALAAVAAAQAAGLLLPRGSPERLLVFDLVSIPAGALAASACALAARRSAGAARAAWALVAAGMAAYAIGSVLWSYEEIMLGVAAPLAGVNAVGFASAIVLTLAGVLTLLLAGGASRTAAAGVILDGAIAAGGVFLVFWPALAPAGGGLFDPGAFAVISYAFCLLMLATVALVGWRRGAGGGDRALLVLGLAFAVMTAGGLLAGEAASRGAFATDAAYNAVWLAGIVLLALAAAMDSGRPRAFRLATGVERGVPIGAFLLGAGGVWTVHDTDAGPMAEIVLGVMLVGLLARWILDVREHGALLRDRAALAREVEDERNALREAELTAGVGSWRLDLDRDDLRWSDGLYALMGRDRAAGPLARSAAEAVLAPDLRLELRARLPDILAGHPLVAADARVPHPDGGTRWFTVTVRAAPGLGRRAVAGTVLDVTARKEAELKRDEAAALATATFQAIPAYVAVLDPDARIVRANADLEDLARGRAPLLQLPDIVPAADRDRLAAFLATTWESGAASTEAALRHAGGARPVLLTSRAFRTRDARLAVVVGLDLTGLRRAEAAARQAERLASLGAMVEGVAHEINNPLTYARGSVEILGMRAAERGLDDVAPDVARALAGLDRIALVADALATAARPSAGVRRELRARDVLARVAASLAARDGDAVAVREDAASDATVLANEDDITNVLTILAANAADAMRGREGAITFRSRDEGRDVLLEVEDAGRGIPREDAARIFTPFHTTKAEGTGLSLTLARTLAHAHGGDLTFRSTPGAGTTFTLRLPRVGEAARS